ncbi:MAG: hypothetical protein ACHREM_08925 [Polyangiales bacterium]
MTIATMGTDDGGTDAMTLRKIADEQRPCQHSEHEPPNMIVLSPGTWEHTCPGCGAKVVFHVRGAYLKVEPVYAPHRSNTTVNHGDLFAHLDAVGGTMLPFERPRRDSDFDMAFVKQWTDDEQARQDAHRPVITTLSGWRA